METLKQKRLTKGITQKELAEMLNIFPERIPLLESCTHYPNEETRKKLETIFGKLDFSGCEKYKIKATSRRQALKKLKEFIKCILGMNATDQKNMIYEAITQLKKLI